jgi:hypothetical protein
MDSFSQNSKIFQLIFFIVKLASHNVLSIGRTIRLIEIHSKYETSFRVNFEPTWQPIRHLAQSGLEFGIVLTRFLFFLDVFFQFATVIYGA